MTQSLKKAIQVWPEFCHQLIHWKIVRAMITDWFRATKLSSSSEYRAGYSNSCTLSSEHFTFCSNSRTLSSKHFMSSSSSGDLKVLDVPTCSIRIYAWFGLCPLPWRKCQGMLFWFHGKPINFMVEDSWRKLREQVFLYILQLQLFGLGTFWWCWPCL